MTHVRDEIRGWLAGAVADPPATAAAATLEAYGAISDLVAGAIVNVLNQSGLRNFRKSHLLCDFLAAAACAMQEFEQHLERGVEEMVTAVLASRKSDGRSRIPEPVARMTAQAAADGLMRLSPTRHFDDALRALRMLAISMCPAPEHHRLVVRCCLNLIEKEMISDATRQQLTHALPPGWMTAR